jgi:hypothetical protein
MDEPFPCECESAFKKARRITDERLRSPQVPVLVTYVPPPPEFKARKAPQVVVVRNDSSHILLRTRFKQLFEDMERARQNRNTPTNKRVSITDHLSKRTRDSPAAAPGPAASVAPPNPK